MNANDLPAWIAAAESEDRSPRARVRALARRIAADPARNLDAARLADEAAVSPRTLSRLFRRETGTTPAKFVERARLRLARALIERTGLGVALVAQRSGFRNREHLRRAFRRHYGMGPRRYGAARRQSSSWSAGGCEPR